MVHFKSLILVREWKERHKAEMKTSFEFRTMEEWKKSSSHHDKLPGRTKKKKKGITRCPMQEDFILNLRNPSEPRQLNSSWSLSFSEMARALRAAC